MDLSHLSDELRAHLDDKTAARERGLAGSRSAIRACGNAIRAMHRHDLHVAEALLSEAQENLDEARSVLQDHQDMRYAGFVHDAEKEVAMGGFRIEARMTGF